MRAPLALLLPCLLLAACNTEVGIIDNEAEGDDPGECSDGADNDQDGDYDCDDEDCEGSPECDEDPPDDSEPPEDTAPEPDENNAPSAPEIGTDPTCVEADESVTCVITTASVDPDGDQVGYAWAWTADSGASASGEVLRANETSAGERWTCTVTPSDPWVAGPSAEASLQVHGPCQTHLNTSFDSGLSGWTTLGGSVSAGSGYVELQRTREEWAAASWQGSRSDHGRIELEATMSVHAEQGLVAACITDGEDGTGFEVPGLSHYGAGYCIILSSETQNGSSMGAFLVSNDVTGNVSILASSLFEPEYGRRYTIALERSCAGDFVFQVDGSTVGTANNVYASGFDRLLLVGGEDDYTSDFPGGRVHSLRFEGCE
jgi:hypothetical protein